ncbi:MAG: hypothetical protein KAH25_01510 [Bacteroidales bacterium]|nr:hypothetical protein [Bacteroidales bacterium]
MKQFIFLLALSSLISCNKINKENLTVVEGIVLGTNFNNFAKYADSLNIPNASFFSEQILKDKEDAINNNIFSYYTNIFNISKLHNHSGLLYPITYIGNDNIIGINILFGYTGNSILQKPELKIYDSKNDPRWFNQVIVSDLKSEIKSLLTSKYGKPTLNSYYSKSNKFNVIVGNYIQQYNGSDDFNGAITTWETEYLTIELFEGILTNSTIFEDGSYTKIFFSSNNSSNENVEYPCYSYVSLKYLLKDEVIKKLSLNKLEI